MIPEYIGIIIVISFIVGWFGCTAYRWLEDKFIRRRT